MSHLKDSTVLLIRSFRSANLKVSEEAYVKICNNLGQGLVLATETRLMRLAYSKQLKARRAELKSSGAKSDYDNATPCLIVLDSISEPLKGADATLTAELEAFQVMGKTLSSFGSAMHEAAKALGILVAKQHSGHPNPKRGHPKSKPLTRGKPPKHHRPKR